MKIADSVLELVGHTPMVRLNRLPKPGGGPAFRGLRRQLAEGELVDDL